MPIRQKISVYLFLPRMIKSEHRKFRNTLIEMVFLILHILSE
ncbi:hypothetical protein [Sideroxydans sp. CL21]|nr:hypothetical protein [Sideroxydans sp. CL21]